jgi:hypothetical protein
MSVGNVVGVKATPALLALVLAACNTVVPSSLPLLTDPEVVPVELCNADAALPHVNGTLEGLVGAPDSAVWIRDGAGRRMIVLWPAGYSARMSSSLELAAEDGSIVARVGDRVELPHAALEDHAGTLADPYPAAGLVFDRCYSN